MLLDDIETILQAVQIKQSKYKYDFIMETKFNQKTNCLFRVYSVIKFHTEVIEHKRYKIVDVTKTGKLAEILNWLAEELEWFNNRIKKAVDSS